MAGLIMGIVLMAAGTVPPNAAPTPARAPVPAPGPTVAPAAPGPAPDNGSNEALRAALADAEGADPARHAALLRQLGTRAFLEALDSSADYAEASRRGLRAGKVVEALAKNPAPGAQKAFLALTTNRIFLAHDERAIALIQAGVNVRPAPTALVRFWDRHSRSDDGFTPTTIVALVDNGSAPAIALLERKLIDPTHGDDDKLSWMRTDILRHRNDLPLLQGCERLLKGNLKKPLRPRLVEVLFDYRPGEWFRPANVASAPPIESAAPAALAELGKIGALALRKIPLGATQKAAVELRLREIETRKEEASR